ncbi:MAG: Cys-tRNA(Pro) deacylase [Actinomycetota bacterium]|nr:Cys-tRNA(Pro) deacylase [Actinomycetota bacterium]MDH5278718.1 Cys-tRNA(Pro) deacylase [Actinomycetota bacterium]
MARRGRTAGGRGTPATVVLERSGCPFEIHAYPHDPRQRSFGEEAATALQVAPSRVFKTLVAQTDTTLVVAVVPVASRLDLKALAATVGAKTAAMADGAAVERSTGYVLGGISPLGQRRRLPTVVDGSALAHATVYVSAGRRGLEVELDPHDLVALTDAVTGWVSRPG